MGEAVREAGKWEEEDLRDMVKTGAVHSGYLAAVMEEPHLVDMLQEYLQKVVVSGETVSLARVRDYEDVRQKVMDRYLTFFLGDAMSSEEFQIMQQYIGQKGNKYKKYLSNQEESLECTWTRENQRLQEGVINFRDIDDHSFDILDGLDFAKKEKHYQFLLGCDGITSRQKAYYYYADSKIM